ncbi:hypothetical protein AYR62_02820 [Secundilactobacillus paracollinoides]|uniref:Uncharacterized protein n=1 Tax=Secundilactobacillus paracollinoides TaxID=240427 RepID=A0A1B2IUI8_9LACO|nr:lipocalin family protein [Secundilactobacillus paracollinoides]ANZ59910.1 hypothetical protein AYR61_00090 [Secundilactobacillus paracollinoides]ANZ63132.1 hypothetical protein AYR62_02820 [Secundilactobacillus paracollinoides]ANZ65701.1 hypothetical protein AYR63_00095 [Secundilactobacillus paracollinoides]KRL75555.1 hypothetical protein FC17_GL002612 [Secundilactobacillus paracollinoides DSM 15502 = JCM 11969]
MNVGKRLETGRQLFLKRYRSDRRIQALTWVIIVVVILGIGVHLYHRTPKRQPVRHNPWYFLVGTPANELPSAIEKHNSGASKLVFNKNGEFTQTAADYSSDPDSGTWQVDGKTLQLKESLGQTTRANIVSVKGIAGGYRYAGYKLTHVRMTAVDGSDTSAATVYLVYER